MSITILPELETRLRARAEAEGLSVEAYLDRIAKDDQAAEEELQTLALEGLDSGPSVAGDDQFWDERRRLLMERRSQPGTR